MILLKRMQFIGLVAQNMSEINLIVLWSTLKHLKNILSTDWLRLLTKGLIMILVMFILN